MSAFKAFLSDDESDAGTPAVTKPKPTKPKPSASKPVAPKAAQPPIPVTAKPNDKPRGKPTTMEPSQPKTNNGDREAHRGGRGRGRGPRPGDRNERGKRIFDKHSGTGRTKTEKKGGAGGHNWGNEVDPNYNTNVSISIDNQHSASQVEEAAKLATSGVEPDVTKPEEDETPKEPEKETFSLDDYFKKKAEKRSGLGFESLTEAKVEEVAEGKQYAKNKDSGESDVFIKFGTDEKKIGKKKGQGRANQRKIVEDIGFKVKNPDEERSFRGGRGGHRGRGRGRARGGGRGGYNGPRVDNSEQSFPQLGAS